MADTARACLVEDGGFDLKADAVERHHSVVVEVPSSGETFNDELRALLLCSQPELR